MSAVAVNGAAKLSAVDLVKTLPAEFKTAVLDELLRELASSPEGPVAVSLRTTDGSLVGHLMPAELAAPAADRVYLDLAPEMRAEMMKPYVELNLDDTLAAGQMSVLLSPAARS